MRRNRNMSKMNISVIDYAFHIHTSRCGHASLDSAEEYVKTALEFGCKSITFTDHAPFPENPFSGRMRMEELDAYEQELLELRQKYARKIAITIGLEVEYLPEYHSYYQELYERFDLLLLGQHHTSFSNGHYTYEKMIPEEKRYLRLIESIPEAIETGLFAVVAHPERSFHEDCEWTDTDDRIRDEIFDAALKHGGVLEWNAALVENGKMHERFWESVPEEMQMVYGVDAHSVEEMRRRILGNKYV